MHFQAPQKMCSKLSHQRRGLYFVYNPDSTESFDSSRKSPIRGSARSVILGLTVWLPALYLLLLGVYIVPNISSVFLSSVSLSISIPSCLKVSVRVFMRVLGNSTSPSVFPAFSLIGHSTRNCRSSVRSTTHRLLGLVISLIVCVVLWSPSVGGSLPQSLS